MTLTTESLSGHRFVSGAILMKCRLTLQNWVKMVLEISAKFRVAKKKLGQNSTGKIDRRIFCMSREFAGGATLSGAPYKPATHKNFRGRLGHTRGATGGRKNGNGIVKNWLFLSSKVGRFKFFRPKVLAGAFPRVGGKNQPHKI